MRDIYYEREFLTKRGGGAVKPLCSCCLLLLAVAGCLLWLAAAAVRAKACARVFCVSQPFLFCSLSSFSSLFITIITSHHHHHRPLQTLSVLFFQFFVHHHHHQPSPPLSVQSIYRYTGVYIYISKARKRPLASQGITFDGLWLCLLRPYADRTCSVARCPIRPDARFGMVKDANCPHCE